MFDDENPWAAGVELQGGRCGGGGRGRKPPRSPTPVLIA